MGNLGRLRHGCGIYRTRELRPTSTRSSPPQRPLGGAGAHGRRPPAVPGATSALTHPPRSMQTLAPQRIVRRGRVSYTRPSGRAHSASRPRGVGRASWIRARGGRVGGSGGNVPAGRRKPQGPRARRMRPRPPGARRGSPARRRDAHQASRTASCRGGTIPAGKAPRPTGSAERSKRREPKLPHTQRSPGPRPALRATSPPRRTPGPARHGACAGARCALRAGL